VAVDLSIAETKTITGEDLFAMGDIGRCELVEGRIVPMSPTGFLHGEIEAFFVEKLRAFVGARKLGKVATGEAGVYIRRNPDTVRGADVLFISNERVAKIQSRSYLDVAPELIVEVLSPNDAWTEVTQKLREYFTIGVLLVWIVDPEARVIYAYRSMTDVREFTADDMLPGDDVLPGFSVQVAQLFGA
jgi:Uma2 family endonuclease